MPRNGSGVYNLPAGSTFTPNTLIQSSVVNGINNDLATDANTPRPIVAGGTGATTAATALAALGGLPLAGGTMTGDINLGYHALTNPGGLLLTGYLNGLTLSNNVSDAVNDIDIAIGSAASDSTVPTLMTLASSLTKRTDAAWAVGTGVGGWLDGTSMPNGTGHAFLIQRSDTGAVDIGFSASLTPTLPTNYDRKRRIGSIIRQSAAILSFRQFGNRFILNTVQQIRSSTAGVTDVLITCISPAGIRTRPILSSQLSMNTASAGQNVIGDGDSTTATFQFQAANASAIDTTVVDTIYTNTSSQVRFTTSASAGTFLSNVLNSLGWWDDRGING